MSIRGFSVDLGSQLCNKVRSMWEGILKVPWGRCWDVCWNFSNSLKICNFHSSLMRPPSSVSFYRPPKSQLFAGRIIRNTMVTIGLHNAFTANYIILIKFFYRHIFLHFCFFVPQLSYLNYGSSNILSCCCSQHHRMLGLFMSPSSQLNSNNGTFTYIHSVHLFHADKLLLILTLLTVKLCRRNSNSRNRSERKWHFQPSFEKVEWKIKLTGKRRNFLIFFLS